MDANDVIAGLVAAREPDPPKRIQHNGVRYNNRIAELICDKIAMGFTLEKALKAGGALAPSPTLFWRWLELYPKLAAKYQRARLMQADILADKMLDHAESAVADPKKASAYKVASEILYKMAQARNPASYGNKVQIEDVKKPLSPREIQAEIQALQAMLGLVPAEGKRDVHVPPVPDHPGDRPGHRDVPRQLATDAILGPAENLFNVPSKLQ